MKKRKHVLEDGISLVEILVVITIFAVLGIIVSSSLMLTIQGTRKSESLIKMRENLNYSLGVIERNLRNANSITECPNSDTSTISYVDQYGNTGTFSCVGVGGISSYIASGSARLTSDQVEITNCSFVCNQTDSSKPPVIEIDIAGQDASASGKEKSAVTISSQVYLRN